MATGDAIQPRGAEERQRSTRTQIYSRPSPDQPSPATECSTRSDRSGRTRPAGNTHPLRSSLDRYHGVRGRGPSSPGTGSSSSSSSSCDNRTRETRLSASAHADGDSAVQTYRGPVPALRGQVAPIDEAERVAQVRAVVEIVQAAWGPPGSLRRDGNTKYSAVCVVAVSRLGVVRYWSHT